jgi:CspA family cold shock protein
MSRDTVDNGLPLTGTIKWFDPVKVFGFIVSDEIDMVILLHANVLRNFGQISIADGVEIKVVAHRSDRGIQAAEVLSVPLPVHLTHLGTEKWTRWMMSTFLR